MLRANQFAQLRDGGERQFVAVGVHTYLADRRRPKLIGPFWEHVPGWKRVELKRRSHIVFQIDGADGFKIVALIG